MIRKKANLAAVVAVLVLVAIQYFSAQKNDIALPEQEQPSAVSSYPENAHDADKDYHWAHKDTLDDHFKRHGGDFSAGDAEDYARMANEFYLSRDSFEVKIGEDGISRVYDPKTNTFGAYNKNGSTRTFFKPSDGQAYFDRQPGERE